MYAIAADGNQNIWEDKHIQKIMGRRQRRRIPGTMESTPGNAVLSIACFTALTAASYMNPLAVSTARKPQVSMVSILTVASCPCWSTPNPMLTARSLLKPFGVRSLAPWVCAEAICNTAGQLNNVLTLLEGMQSACKHQASDRLYAGRLSCAQYVQETDQLYFRK